MKKILAALIFALLAGSCARDNSSTVSFQLDEAGCFVNASGYDTTSSVLIKESQWQTVTYIWDCSDYVNEAEEIDVREKKVTLVFEGTSCLTLTATIIGFGYCTQGATPIL